MSRSRPRSRSRFRTWTCSYWVCCPSLTSPLRPPARSSVGKGSSSPDPPLAPCGGSGSTTGTPHGSGRCSCLGPDTGPGWRAWRQRQVLVSVQQKLTGTWSDTLRDWAKNRSAGLLLLLSAVQTRARLEKDTKTHTHLRGAGQRLNMWTVTVH